MQRNQGSVRPSLPPFDVRRTIRSTTNRAPHRIPVLAFHAISNVQIRVRKTIPSQATTRATTHTGAMHMVRRMEMGDSRSPRRRRIQVGVWLPFHRRLLQLRIGSVRKVTNRHKEL